MNKLKLERNTLKKVHERLARILSEQCAERDELLEELLQNSEESTKALLLQEVYSTNSLPPFFIVFSLGATHEQTTTRKHAFAA